MVRPTSHREIYREMFKCFISTILNVKNEDQSPLPPLTISLRKKNKIVQFSKSQIFLDVFLCVWLGGGREADGSKFEVNNPKLFISTSWVGDVSQ